MIDLHAGAARPLGASSSSIRRCSSTRSTSARCRPGPAHLRAVDRDARLHRDRDRLEHGRGGQGPRQDVPKAVNLVLIAVLGVYVGISVVALSALPVTAHGGTSRSSGQPVHHGFRIDPVLGIIDQLGLHGAALHARAVLRRPARRDDPVHRHQRGPDRHLAPVVVAGRAPPAAGGLRAPAPALPHAVVHDRLLLGLRGAADLSATPTSSATSTRSARCCRSRPPTPPSSAAHHPPRSRAALPDAVERAHPRGGSRSPRSSGASARRRLGRRRGAAPRGAVRRHPVDGGRHGRLLHLPPRAGPQPRQGVPHRARPSARPTSRSSSTAPRSCRSSATTSAPQRCSAPPS